MTLPHRDLQDAGNLAGRMENREARGVFETDALFRRKRLPGIPGAVGPPDRCAGHGPDLTRGLSGTKPAEGRRVFFGPPAGLRQNCLFAGGICGGAARFSGLGARGMRSRETETADLEGPGTL